MQFLIGISFTSKKAAEAIDMFQIVSLYFYYSFLFQLFLSIAMQEKKNKQRKLSGYFSKMQKEDKMKHLVPFLMNVLSFVNNFIYCPITIRLKVHSSTIKLLS